MQNTSSFRFLVEKSPGGLDFDISIGHNGACATGMTFSQTDPRDRPPTVMRLTQEEADELFTQLWKQGAFLNITR